MRTSCTLINPPSSTPFVLSATQDLAGSLGLGHSQLFLRHLVSLARSLSSSPPIHTFLLCSRKPVKYRCHHRIEALFRIGRAAYSQTSIVGRVWHRATQLAFLKRWSVTKRLADRHPKASLPPPQIHTKETGLSLTRHHLVRSIVCSILIGR
jgi:hypothetical protein